MVENMTSELHVLGAGGHAAVVCDAARLSGAWSAIYVYDDLPSSQPPSHTTQRGSFSDLMNLTGPIEAVVALGDANARLMYCEEIIQKGFTLVNVVHPSAVVSEGASLGLGTVVFAGAVVNPGCVTGKGSIVNTGAIVDHHCELGQGVHVCPGATLAGRVQIGNRTWVGVGSCVRDGVIIGPDALIGAGAVVVSDIPGNTKVIGCPARPI